MRFCAPRFHVLTIAVAALVACGQSNSDSTTGSASDDGGGLPDGSQADGAAPAQCGLEAAWPTLSATSGSGAASPTNGASQAIDHDLGTYFASGSHAVAQNEESLAITFDVAHPVNTILLAPRLVGGRALGFPVEFGIAWFDGKNWNDARAFTHYPAPTGSCVTLTLPDTVTAQGVRLTAKVLGAGAAAGDAAAGYDLELADLGASYDPALEGVVVTPTSATSTSVASTSFSIDNLRDGDPSTSFSSATHTTAANAESLSFDWPTPSAIDEIRLLPRYGADKGALGFPVDFTISAVDGTKVTTLGTYTGFPAPHEGDWIVLPLPQTVTAHAIRIDATTLGSDKLGNFALQLAEAGAGYDVGLDRFRFVGNDGSAGHVQIANAGSQSVNRPDQLQHWDFDARGIVIAPAAGANQNIYAPNIVHTGAGAWNIYFGGWDGSATGNDRLYLTTTGDDFLTIGAHALIIDHGVFQHTNNDSTLKVADGDWRMVYTCASGGINKPAYSRSTDGSTWTPNVGTTSTLLNMTGYPNWAGADVNGGNVVYRDDQGTWHLYFIDFNNFTGVHHATSTDFVNYTYVGKITSETMVPNDWKAFSYGGSTYYVGAYHFNGPSVWTTVSTSLTTVPARTVAFDHAGADDLNIVAPGIVQDAGRIYGMLYGAGATSNLSENRIFASWLQKKIIFSNAAVRWGDIERSYGPDVVYVLTAEAASVETGRFEVYDTDGTTLLYRSPVVTMRSGDQWSYDAGY